MIRNRKALLSVMVGVVMIGTLTILAGRASAPPPVSFEVESGAAPTLPAVVASNDPTASGTKSVKFGTATTPTPPPPTSNFLTRSGKTLMLNGAPFKFVGVDAYGIIGGCDGLTYSDSDLDAFFGSMHPNSVIRTWATERSSLADIDRVVARAKADNQLLLISLLDGGGACNKNNFKPDAAWYRTGYKTDSFMTWVQTVAARYKDSPAVAMWEVTNEPGWTGACNTTASPSNDCGLTATELKSYLDTIAARIKAVDPNHLIESGTVTNIAALSGRTNFATVHSGPNIDVASIHEYEYDYDGNTGAYHNLATYTAAAGDDNKPLIIGETGALLSMPTTQTCRNPSVTLQTLAKSKLDDYFAKGVNGVLIWNWNKAQPSWVTNGCTSNQHFFYGVDNPVLSMLKAYNP